MWVALQEVSSMNGKVLDSWTLTKPMDWEPDFNVRNLFTSYFISNYSTTDFLESTGTQNLPSNAGHCCRTHWSISVL